MGGVKKGKGKLKFADSTYLGPFENDKPHGDGV